jgi:hypothetical protein
MTHHAKTVRTKKIAFRPTGHIADIDREVDKSIGRVLSRLSSREPRLPPTAEQYSATRRKGELLIYRYSSAAGPTTTGAKEPSATFHRPAITITGKRERRAAHSQHAQKPEAAKKHHEDERGNGDIWGAAWRGVRPNKIAVRRVRRRPCKATVRRALCCVTVCRLASTANCFVMSGLLSCAVAT